jgi:hypothetical protein
MPELSRFFGVIIRMFGKDHPPPHFHVKYGEYKYSINIETGEIIACNLPTSQYNKVKEWVKEHIDELRENWNEGQKNNPKWTKIEPFN